MNDIIFKYQKNMLEGQKLHVKKKIKHHSFPKHWHSYYEMIYYHNCRGTCVLNGVVYPVEGDCLFLLTPKDFHEIEVPDAPGAEAYVVSFSEQIIDSCIFAQVNKGPVYISNLTEWAAVQICKLHQVFTGKMTHRDSYLLHLFNAMLMDVLEQGCSLSHISPDISPMIRESISMMLTDPGGSFTLETFSRKFNVSTTYFSRLFHENAGISFKQYHTLLRIEHAKRLLEERKLPIIDVGCECGFNTPSQFIRSFKNTTGKTPSAYRAAVLQTDKDTQ